MNMPRKVYKPASDEELKKLRGSGPCALCSFCGKCTKGHFHCAKCICIIPSDERMKGNWEKVQFRRKNTGQWFDQ